MHLPLQFPKNAYIMDFSLAILSISWQFGHNWNHHNKVKKIVKAMSSKFSDSSEVGPLQIGKHVSHGKTLAVVDAGDAELLGRSPYANVWDESNWLEVAQLGYKQELKRNFSTFEVFGIAFSIIAILPSIASTLSLSMPAGPVGMVWVSLSGLDDVGCEKLKLKIGLVCCFRFHYDCI